MPAYGTPNEQVRIDLSPTPAAPAGGVATLTHAMTPHPPEIIAAAEDAWRRLLVVLADILTDMPHTSD